MASPRPQFYHAAAEIDGALRGTERCIRRAEGVSLIVGPPGTGKSLLLLKLAEQIRDDFDVALLTGASICTRRALWQAIMAAIGEPYRGIDETELRIAIVERIRGLAAAGSGLVILVDEAHTLPTRLIEELRLLTNVPTPLPAVHIVLVGTTRIDEMLGSPRMASLAQRVAVRGYLEPLDHAETVAYLQTQVRAAGLHWEKLFAPGSDDAVYQVTEGVPRLINQVCDHALVLVAECGRPVTPADIASAWRDIQRLPAPNGLENSLQPPASAEEFPSFSFDGSDDDLTGDGFGVIEFGALDEDGGTLLQPDQSAASDRGEDYAPTDPFGGPDVELVFDGSGDPFAEFFRQEQQASQRHLLEGPDDFRDRQRVASREGQSLGRLLATIGCEEVGGPTPVSPPGSEGQPATSVPGDSEPAVDNSPAAVAEFVNDEIDDSDMVVIEEDLHETLDQAPATVFTVRPSDYRSLFTRLRRSQ
jgi:type II secretory pathway predicted ATPase ExeA